MSPVSESDITEPLVSTRQRLLALVQKHPEWSQRQYAAALGVTPARVAQLLAVLHARHVWIV